MVRRVAHNREFLPVRALHLDPIRAEDVTDGANFELRNAISLEVQWIGNHIRATVSIGRGNIATPCRALEELLDDLVRRR
jgi:hypothetical protein